jgi:predicted translin family RNA/ssDNA-binding protein
MGKIHRLLREISVGTPMTPELFHQLSILRADLERVEAGSITYKTFNKKWELTNGQQRNANV